MGRAGSLEIERLKVGYGKAAAVIDNLTLHIAPGERVAVLAPSGTGKTTLFRALTGFARVQSGSVRVDGIDVTSARRGMLRDLRRRVAVVSQRHDLVDTLRNHQNVMAGALGRWSTLRALRYLLRPTAEELATAETALTRVGLAGKLHGRTSELSGGQHQRVAIARALVQEPSILLADEPVASLDPRLSEQILTLLCEVAEEAGTTLLCSLHQVHLAERFFARIIELGPGATVLADREPLSARPVIAEGI